MYRYITDELPQNISCFSINEITRNNDLKVISLHSHHKPILIYISNVQKFSLKEGIKTKNENIPKNTFMSIQILFFFRRELIENGECKKVHVKIDL